MSKSARAAAIVAVCAVAALPVPAQAAKRHKAVSRAVTITNSVVALTHTDTSTINVGTSDGQIGGVGVHGALRARVTGPSTNFTAVGTLFYPAGTLNYTAHGSLTSNPDGSKTDTGTFVITGGTGRYLGAHGTLSGSSVIPANSPSTTYTDKGRITYR